MATRLQHRGGVKLGGLVWFVAGAGLLLAGCFYLDPVNRRPKFMAVTRLCDSMDPTAPCDPVLHHGEWVTVKAEFSDPDGNADDGGLHWRVTAWDDTHTSYDRHRLYETPDTMYEGSNSTPRFLVRSILEETGGPVLCVVVDVDVYDDRGAASVGSRAFPVDDGPTLAQCQSARTSDMFATHGDPSEGPRMRRSVP
jgi:hypothetical protein